MAARKLDEWTWVRERYGSTMSGCVALINQHLIPYKNDPDGRLDAVNKLERGFTPGRGEHARNMLRALAIWRLRQQITGPHPHPVRARPKRQAEKRGLQC
jgi:hypothetical protein